jgi:hypothetical protein
VGGLQTTLPFHRWLVEQPEFTDPRGAGLSTDLVARKWRPAELAATAALRAAELAAQAVTASAPVHDIAAEAASDDGPAGTWWRAGIAEATENQT